MKLKRIGATQMKGKRQAAWKYSRFCDLCGTYVGDMNVREWQEEGRMCGRCAEAYAGSVEIQINRVEGTPYSWELSAERSRASRFM